MNAIDWNGFIGWLLVWTVQCALFLGMGLGILALLKKMPSGSRHPWLLALLVLVALLPVLNLGVMQVRSMLPGPVFEIALPAEGPVPLVEEAMMAEEAAPGEIVMKAGGAGGFAPWAVIGVALWAAGVLAMLARAGLSWLGLRELVRASKEVASGPLFERLEVLRRRAGVKRRVGLLLVDRPLPPMTWGVRRSWIALPAAAKHWEEERLNSVLVHELAHVRRRDCFVEWLCQWVCALQWCNPLVWISARRLREECEHLCDDEVLQAGVTPSDYARTVLDAARWAPPKTVAAMARPGDLKFRLSRILDDEAERGVGRPLFAVMAIPMAVFLAWPLAWVEAARPKIAVVGDLVVPTRIADGFDYPVGAPNGEGYYVGRGFEPNGHLGDDWNGRGGGNSDLGDPVHAIGDGLVVLSKDHRAGWGNVMIVRHAYADGDRVRYVDSLYGHLDERRVEKGDLVKRGEVIGTIGTNRGMYVAHLHFEIRKNLNVGLERVKFPMDYSAYHSPRAFIQARRPPAGD